MRDDGPALRDDGGRFYVVILSAAKNPHDKKNANPMTNRIYKALLLAAVMVAAAACGGSRQQEPRVMARYVPERMDDFVFENDLIAGRVYGKALEGNPTAPGIDIWVKTPGGLVANERYRMELEDGKTYHKDWGNGKDCYKVAVSLGGGASAPLIDGEIQYPATNWRSYEILEQTPDSVVFVLHYPQWESKGEKMALDKKFTVTSGTYFVAVEDTWTFSGEYGDELTVAAGVFRHPAQNTLVEELVLQDRYALWEHASDQSVEPEDGMIGVAVHVPGAARSFVTEDGTHGLTCKRVKSGETFSYSFGSCWSKGEIKTAGQWFELVRGL